MGLSKHSKNLKLTQDDPNIGRISYIYLNIASSNTRLLSYARLKAIIVLSLKILLEKLMRRGGLRLITGELLGTYHSINSC